LIAPLLLWERLREIRNEGVSLIGKTRVGIIILLIFGGWFLIALPVRSSLWLDRLFIDAYQRWAAGWYSAHSSLVIVAIDTETLQAGNTRWPWPRREIGRLLKRIEEGKPRIILMDILFQNPQEGPQGSENDRALASTIRELGNIALIYLVEETRSATGLEINRIHSLDSFREAAALEGFIWAIVDDDGLIRSFAVRDERLGVDSCSLQIARKFDTALPLPAPDDDGVSRSLLTLPRRSGGIPILSAKDLLDGKIPMGVLQDKIVVLGITAMILHDYHQSSHGLISGVEILASSLDTLLNHRAIRRLKGPIWRGILAVFGCVLGIYCHLRSWSHAGLRSFLWLAGCLILGAVCSVYSGVSPPLGVFFLSWVYGSACTYAILSFLDFMAVQIMRAEAQAIGDIQKLIFPSTALELPNGFYCGGRCLPCESAGGDYFDYFQLKDGDLVFLLGDVTGHGFAAAMVTTLVKAVVTQFQFFADLSPVHLMEILNKVIFEITKRKRMITLAVGRLNLTSGVLQISFGGHLPAFFLRRDGTLSEISCPAFPLGATSNFKSNSISITMEPGERLILYTDGFVEAIDWEDKPFEFDRWKEYCRRLPNLSFDSLWNEAIDTIKMHTAGRPFTDDVTLLILGRKES